MDNRRLAIFFLLLAITRFSPMAQAESGAFTATCTAVRGRLLLPVSLNGVGPYPFLVDAGIQLPIVDPDVAAYLKLPANDAPVATPVPAPEALAPLAQEVHLDKLSFADFAPHAEVLGVLNLNALAAKLGVRVAGILPLHQPGYEITIDFAVPSITWRSLVKATLQEQGADTAPLTIDDSGAPSVEVRLNEQHVRKLQLDLSFPGVIGLTNRSLGDVLLINEETPRIQTIIDDTQVETKVRLNDLRIAGNSEKKPPCTILNPGEHDKLGLGFLRRFQVTLNFEYGLIRLTGGEAAYTNTAVSGFGIIPQRTQDGLWLVRVVVNSPAHRLGARTGDVLSAINGNPVDDLSADLLAAQLDPAPGTTASITLVQNNVPQTATLVSEQLF